MAESSRLENRKSGKNTGVLVVDVQGDFTVWKSGSLAVPETGRSFVEAVEEFTLHLHQEGYPVFATQDWHPADHVSFHTNHPDKKPFDVIEIEGRNQVLWPPHCVQGSENARILVDNSLFQAIVRKGQNPKYDSYSGFQDDAGGKTEMDRILKRNGIKQLIVYGIATDYCVKATAVDAVDAGYKVIVVAGLSRGVAFDTTKVALKELEDKGIKIIKKIDELEL